MSVRRDAALTKGSRGAMFAHMTTRRVWCVGLLGVAGLGLWGCEDERPRCAHCGMYADGAPEWMVTSAGRAYDAPKCALREEGSAAALRFRAYYDENGAERLAGTALRFVHGSDVTSPMGDDLVPVRPENVETFVRDHGGEAVAFDAIDASLLQRLDP